MTDQDGKLWTIHIPGGGIKKVHLPPLPDETDWDNFSGENVSRFSFPATDADKIYGDEK